MIGIHVFQHGRERDAHARIRAALELLMPGGLFCVRVDAVGTELEHRHKLVEQHAEGGLTVEYETGSKQGLHIHFFARDELERLVSELVPVVPLRLDRAASRAARARPLGPAGRGLEEALTGPPCAASQAGALLAAASGSMAA